jgi:hypothetical protein
MKFDYDLTNCSNIGLLVKHGNKDNVVLFFDEVEDAACYKASLFRTHVDYANEGFFNLGKVNAIPCNLMVRNYENGYERRKRVDDESLELDNQHGPVFSDGNLLSQTWKSVYCLSYYKNGSELRPDNNGYAKLGTIDKTSFENIKYITTLESSRNDLYINIDFLPCGNYVVVLYAEDRTGNIIRQAMPYYFKVAEASNSEILEAIAHAGRAAGKNTVTFGR